MGRRNPHPPGSAAADMWQLAEARRRLTAEVAGRLAWRALERCWRGVKWYATEAPWWARGLFALAWLAVWWPWGAKW